MFETKINDEYIGAAGAYELAKHNGTSKEKQEYLRGYMKAMERAKDMWDEMFDPPMSDEEYRNSQAAGLRGISAL